MSTLSTLILISMITQTPSTPMFTDAERGAAHAYWSAQGRYTVGLPSDMPAKGVWQVRLTPEGSSWLLKYQNATGGKGAPPTAQPTGLPSDRSAWKSWVQARIARDRRNAQDVADSANFALQPSARGSLASRSGTPVRQTPPPDAADPGPIPPALLAAVGNPPDFASVVTPMQYTITFDDGDVYMYVDNVAVPPAYAYYRFSQGVAAVGTRLADADLAAVFSSAGMSASEQRVALSVSRLEGTFEAVNTYDTGFVSVGFLQFITLDNGRHSLSEVLQREKADRPDDFARDFHRYGIDVTVDGVLNAIDPATGAELTGPDAVRKIVDDKRLIAIFQRAGRHSAAFQAAQVKIAKSRYWPADDPVVVNLGAQTVTGKVSDVIQSEAGMATLFDRKVNRGSCEPISLVVARVMQEHTLTSIAAAARYEREIVTALKYRADFLSDTTLSQPLQ